jgi:hypothetical protein
MRSRCGPRTFFVPRANETYRVNGRARVCVDPALKQRFAADGKEPATVILIAVEQAFQHWRRAGKQKHEPTCAE